VPVCRTPSVAPLWSAGSLPTSTPAHNWPALLEPLFMCLPTRPPPPPRQHFLEQAITSQISISRPRKSRQAGRPVRSNRTTRPAATHMPPHPTHPGGSTTNQHEVTAPTNSRTGSATHGRSSQKHVHPVIGPDPPMYEVGAWLVGDSAGVCADPAAAPSGVVMFLFTDIEGSTRRWEADAAVADLLRGPYQPNRYGDVILPFTIQRRPTPGPPTRSKHPSVAGRTTCTGGRRASNRLTTTARSSASQSNWNGRPPGTASPQSTRRTNRTR